jgi:hypothetical protein
MSWAHLLGARFRFDLPGRSPSPTRHPLPGGHAHHAESNSALVALDRRCLTWVGPPYPCSRHHKGSRHPPLFTLASRCHFFVCRCLQLMSCPTRPKEVPCHRAPPAPRAYPQCRLPKLGNGIPLSSSSSVSTASVAAFSGCSPTPPTP